MNIPIETACAPSGAFVLPRPAGRFTLSDLLRLLQAEDGVSPATDAQSVPVRPVRAGSALFHQGDVAESIEFVRLGTFKVFATAEDGSEQVLGFAEHADLLGFDALCTLRHPTGAMALEDSWVFTLRVSEFHRWSREVPELDRALHRAASRQLARCHQHADVMAAVVAEVRLARFLIHQAAHQEARGQSPRRFVLRMTRRDLASHLGVAHETVSRAFGALAQWNCLRVEGRDVEVLDVDRLRACGACVAARPAGGVTPSTARRRRRADRNAPSPH